MFIHVYPVVSDLGLYLLAGLSNVTECQYGTMRDLEMAAETLACCGVAFCLLLSFQF